MKVHELSLRQPYFNDVLNRTKEFELRRNNVDFQLGDHLLLIEVVEAGIEPRTILKAIKYILLGGQHGLDKDYVILGLKDVSSPI